MGKSDRFFPAYVYYSVHSIMVQICTGLYPKQSIYRALSPIFTLNRYEFNSIRVIDKLLVGFYSVYVHKPIQSEQIILHI